MIGFVVASVALVAWIYLLLGRGGFWRSNVTDEAIAGARGLPHDNEGPPPAVAAIMPARNEHETVGRAVTAVIAQTYKGPLSLIVVDDQSTDGTAAAAQAAAEDCKASRRTVVLSGGPLPPGWTGKLWAMQQGLQHATERGTSPDY
ncbi:MAG TPA: glycosyltransferase, partial [Hyphomicrobiaceae bacterium]